MQIKRHRYSAYRRARRRSGCMPLTVLFGVITGVLLVQWGWQQVDDGITTPISNDLTAARQAFDRGDLDAAIQAARAIYTQENTRTDALTLLARALIYRSYTDYNRGRDRELALQITQSAAERLNDSAPTLAIHAFVLQANQQSMEAYRVAQRALNREPENTLARVALGLSLGGVGSFDNARVEVERAVETQDWQLDTLRALAISYSDLGRYDEAGKTVERAIEINSRLPVLYFEQALYAIQRGDTDSATMAYYQVLAQDPENVKVRLRLCELSSILRQSADALRYCEAVTEMAPSWADGWHRLGREYFLQGNFANAQKYLNRCSSLQVLQNIPIAERTFECWYIQGQAAEINGDCIALLETYNEFQAMSATAPVSETWVYPPEGPPNCPWN